MAFNRRSAITALFVTVFLDLLGFGMVIPNMAFYAESFHVSDVAVTALGSCYSGMQFAANHTAQPRF